MTRTVAACSCRNCSGSANHVAGRKSSVLPLGYFALLASFSLSVSRASEPLSVSPDAALYESRTAAITLERSEELLQEGQVIEGISHLQQILDAPEDSFIRRPEGLMGARQAALTLMTALPNGEQRIHGTMQAAAANAALRNARESTDTSALREVLQRFPATEAGFAAANQLAATAFDRGDFKTAARLWDDLLRDPTHAHRATSSVIARALMALRLSGRDGRASELAIHSAGKTIQFQGQPSTVGTLLQSITPKNASPPTTGVANTAANELSAPAFPPIWHQEPDDAAKSLFEMWLSSRRSEGRPAAMAVGAIFTPDSVVVRDLSGLAAFGLHTGELLWSAPMQAVIGEPSEKDRTPSIHSLGNLEERYASNGIYSRIAADGERVYVVEKVDRRNGTVRTVSHSPVPAYKRPPIGDVSNRLVAFPLQSPKGLTNEPCWIAGQGSAQNIIALNGHFFLGAPLASGSELLALTEAQQQINLVALEPRTGYVRWIQPLGFVPQSIASDSSRSMNVCQPVVSEGIAVCATNAGFVVAYDVTAARLLWAYRYGDGSLSTPGGEGSGNRTPAFGDPSLPSPLIVRDRRVFLSPPDSPSIHCLDLITGSVRWTVPRDDALYVAYATDNTVMVVGRNACRAHALASGSVLWTTPITTPSGTGVATDSAYLLPLEDGTIATIDMSTGRLIGYDVPRLTPSFEAATDQLASDRWRPGNLFAFAGDIFSVGAAGLTRLAPASAVLESQPPTAPLERARLEIAAGELAPARDRLRSLMASNANSPETDDATKLLRELNYLRLKWQPHDEAEEILAELDSLSVAPNERGRFLLQAAEHDLVVEDLTSLAQRARELSELGLDDPLPNPNDPTYLVTAASWIPQISKAIRDHESVSNPRTVSDPRTEGMLRLLYHPDADVAGRILLESAHQAAADGDLHESELLLLRAAQSPGFRDETAYELARLMQRSGFSPSQNSNSPDRPIESVRVIEKLWSPATHRMCQTFGRSRRDIPIRSQDPLRIVDRGDSRQAKLAIVDLAGGVCLGEFALDSRLRYPSLTRQSTLGHFIPIATSDRVYGLSLLEASRGKPVWEHELPPQDGLLPQLGPYGPAFCTIQTRRELTVLDPRDGSIIWQRIQLPPDRGLNGDHAVGLFGDGEVLALLDSDSVSYTTFNTQTGEKLSSGQLPIDQRRPRRAYGRRLFFVETTDDGSFARLWDPATQTYDIDVHFEGRLHQTSTRNDELVLLFPDGTLKIHDPVANRSLIDVKLDPSDIADAHTIQVFSDADSFYVSLYQIDPNRFEKPEVAHYVYDTPLSTTHVQGRLIAIDRQSAQVRWTRPTDQRSIVDPVAHAAPFLIAIARLSDSTHGNRKSLLVEVIDKRTGAILGRNDSLLPDQLLQCIWNDDEECVELAGLTSTVLLDYNTKPVGAHPFASRKSLKGK